MRTRPTPSHPRPLPARPRRGGQWLGVLTGVVLSLSVSGAAAETAPVHPLLKHCEPPYETACLSALEHSALRQPHAPVRREDGRLVLNRPGQAEPLVLQGPPEPGVQQHYLGPLSGTELHLVARRAGTEALQFLLVGPGALSLPQPAPPWPAPGGLLMLVAEPGLPTHAGSLTLLGKVGPGWRQLWRFDAAGSLGFGFRGWRSDAASARLDWACADGSAAGSVQLRDGPHGWDLVPATPSCH